MYSEILLLGWFCNLCSQCVLAAGRDFLEKPPALSYCQLAGWCSAVSPAAALATQEVQLTRLSAVSFFCLLLSYLSPHGGKPGEQCFPKQYLTVLSKQRHSPTSVNLKFKILKNGAGGVA
jgi:hypothetical protein